VHSQKDPDDWYTKSFLRPVAESILSIVRRIVAAAFARGELREGVDIETAARLANVLMIAVGDARMMPGLDEYYRLYNDCPAPDSRIDDAIEFICRSLLR
jgi:hypothetical protein